MDWTFRLRDRRLRRWVAYILAAVFAYLSAPHSLANPRYALSRAAGAHLSLRLAQSPAATLRASVQDFNQPQLRLSRPTSKSLVSLFNMVYSVRLSINGGFQCGVLRTSVSILWGLSHKVFGLLTVDLSAMHWGPQRKPNEMFAMGRAEAQVALIN